MPVIPERELVRSRHLAARAASFLRGYVRDDAGEVTRAAAPISAWLTGATDLADLRVRYMAAELHLENLMGLTAPLRRPPHSVTEFIAAAGLYYAAFRGEEHPAGAPEVGEVGGRPEWSGRLAYALRNIVLAATQPGTGGNAGGWERLRQSAARYGRGADPPLTNAEYDRALLVLFRGDPRGAAFRLPEVGRGRGACPSCGSADPRTCPPRELDGRPWPCAGSWHDEDERTPGMFGNLTAVSGDGAGE